MALADRLRSDLALMLVLALAVAAIYLQPAWFEFVNWDDDQYVFRNTRVHQWLSWSRAAWAFVVVESSNWHALTWLCYLLDSSLFGARAGAYHLTNVAWHLAASILVYLLLRCLRDETWRPALVAMILAMHPLTSNRSPGFPNATTCCAPCSACWPTLHPPMVIICRSICGRPS